MWGSRSIKALTRLVLPAPDGAETTYRRPRSSIATLCSASSREGQLSYSECRIADTLHHRLEDRTRRRAHRRPSHLHVFRAQPPEHLLLSAFAGHPAFPVTAGQL